jgi:hypothetical protein
LIPAGYSGCLVIACAEPDLGWPHAVDIGKAFSEMLPRSGRPS